MAGWQIKNQINSLWGFIGSAAANTPILGVLGLVAPFRVENSERMLFSLVLLCTVTLFLCGRFHHAEI